MSCSQLFPNLKITQSHRSKYRLVFHSPASALGNTAPAVTSFDPFLLLSPPPPPRLPLPLPPRLRVLLLKFSNASSPPIPARLPRPTPASSRPRRLPAKQPPPPSPPPRPWEGDLASVPFRDGALLGPQRLGPPHLIHSRFVCASSPGDEPPLLACSNVLDRSVNSGLNRSFF